MSGAIFLLLLYASTAGHGELYVLFPSRVVIISLASNAVWTHKLRRKKWISLCPRETPWKLQIKNIKISLGR
jgi:hypothetical protein